MEPENIMNVLENIEAGLNKYFPQDSGETTDKQEPITELEGTNVCPTVAEQSSTDQSSSDVVHEKVIGPSDIVSDKEPLESSNNDIKSSNESTIKVDVGCVQTQLINVSDTHQLSVEKEKVIDTITDHKSDNLVNPMISDDESVAIDDIPTNETSLESMMETISDEDLAQQNLRDATELVSDTEDVNMSLDPVSDDDLYAPPTKTSHKLTPAHRSSNTLCVYVWPVSPSDITHAKLYSVITKALSMTVRFLGLNCHKKQGCMELKFATVKDASNAAAELAAVKIRRLPWTVKLAASADDPCVPMSNVLNECGASLFKCEKLVMDAKDTRRSPVMVENLPPRIPQHLLKIIFPFSSQIDIPRNADGTTKGFAVVYFSSFAEANASVEKVQGMSLDKTCLRIYPLANENELRRCIIRYKRIHQERKKITENKEKLNSEPAKKRRPSQNNAKQSLNGVSKSKDKIQSKLIAADVHKSKEKDALKSKDRDAAVSKDAPKLNNKDVLKSKDQNALKSRDKDAVKSKDKEILKSKDKDVLKSKDKESVKSKDTSTKTLKDQGKSTNLAPLLRQNSKNVIGIKTSKTGQRCDKNRAKLNAKLCRKFGIKQCFIKLERGLCTVLPSTSGCKSQNNLTNYHKAADGNRIASNKERLDRGLNKNMIGEDAEKDGEIENISKTVVDKRDVAVEKKLETNMSEDNDLKNSLEKDVHYSKIKDGDTVVEGNSCGHKSHGDLDEFKGQDDLVVAKVKSESGVESGLGVNSVGEERNDGNEHEEIVKNEKKEELSDSVMVLDIDGNMGLSIAVGNDGDKIQIDEYTARNEEDRIRIEDWTGIDVGRKGIDVGRKGIDEDRTGTDEGRSGISEDRTGTDEGRSGITEDRIGIRDRTGIDEDKTRTGKDKDKTGLNEDKTGIDEHRLGIEKDGTRISEEKIRICEDQMRINEDPSEIHEDRIGNNEYKTAIDEDRAEINEDRTWIDNNRSEIEANVENVTKVENVYLDVSYKESVCSSNSRIKDVLDETFKDAISPEDARGNSLHSEKIDKDSVKQIELVDNEEKRILQKKRTIKAASNSLVRDGSKGEDEFGAATSATHVTKKFETQTDDDNKKVFRKDVRDETESKIIKGIQLKKRNSKGKRIHEGDSPIDAQVDHSKQTKSHKGKRLLMGEVMPECYIEVERLTDIQIKHSINKDATSVMTSGGSRPDGDDAISPGGHDLCTLNHAYASDAELDNTIESTGESDLIESNSDDDITARGTNLKQPQSVDDGIKQVDDRIADTRERIGSCTMTESETGLTHIMLGDVDDADQQKTNKDTNDFEALKPMQKQPRKMAARRGRRRGGRK